MACRSGSVLLKREKVEVSELNLKQEIISFWPREADGGGTSSKLGHLGGSDLEL